ncbi:MAG: hypothetical protein RR482_00530 [Clostridia bacterium]
MYYRLSSKPWGRRQQQVMLVVLCILLFGNIFQAFAYRSVSMRDARMREALVIRVQSEISSARSTSRLLSRTGGSNTSTLLSKVRQHVYGVQQLNDLTASLYGATRTLIQEDLVNAALAAIHTCEGKLVSGMALDAPLSELWQQLDAMLAAAAQLPGAK